MNYNKNDVPIINPSFTFDDIGQGRVMSNVDGEFKLIQCSPSALKDVLNSVDGKLNFQQIERILCEKYPIDGIDSYLSALLNEKILIMREVEDSQGELIKDIHIVGDGILSDTLTSLLDNSNKLNIFRTSLSDFMKSSDFKDCEMFVLCPEEVTYGDILKFNSIMLNAKKMYLPFYYNSHDVTIGPFIIPGKTACIECRTLYHLAQVNSKLTLNSKVDINCIKQLMFSRKYVENLYDSVLNSLCEVVRKELYKILYNRGKLNFLDCEWHFSQGNIISNNLINIHSSTDCQSCNCLRNYHRWSENLKPQFQETVTFSNDSIQYNVGGMRTRTDEEAKEFITQAIRRAGLKVNIERAYTPFDSIIPVFRATVENVISNNTPYRFRNIITRGKGLTEKQSFLSAAFEMAERLSSSYYGEIPVVEASYNEVSDVAIDVISLSNSIENRNTCFEEFNADLPIDWVWAKSLVNGECRLIPAFMAFIGDTKFKGQFLSNGSSGLASGVTLDDAILQGMLEVIEHDAWMIGQANRFILPQIDSNTSSNPILKENISRIQGMGYSVITRDYTNDLNVPVYRTWIVNFKDHTHYAISGVGASIFPELALERSVTEAIQSADITINTNQTYFGRCKSEYLGKSKDSVYSLDYFKIKDILGKSSVNSIPKGENYSDKSVKELISELIAKLQKKLPDCDVLYVDLTRSVLEVPTVRIIVTGGMQILNYPLISVSPRMYDYGIKMNYTDVNLSYCDLYLGAYPH